MNKARKSLYIIIIGMILVAGQFFFSAPDTSWGQTDESGTNASGDTILAFTSDAHNTYYNGSVDRLAAWIDRVQGKYGTIDAMGFCGDMANSGAAGAADYWTFAQRVIDTVAGKGVEGIYTTGNHEYYPGDIQYNGGVLTSENNQTIADRFTVGGVGKEGDNYRIYCLGSASSKQEYRADERNTMEDYLMHVGNDKPIIVMTHYPLHFCLRHNDDIGLGNRVTGNADSVIDSLNTAATNDTPDNPADDRTIIFLWGHNHSEFDPYYDQIFVPGDSIQYEENGYKEIKFYYGAAGCMSDSEYSDGSASVKGKGLLIQIRSDDSIGFAYCNAKGEDVTEEGNYPKIVLKDKHVTGLRLDKQSLTVKKGSSAKLTAIIEPADATNKNLIWTITPGSVAALVPGQTGNTVAVKGVSKGTAVIKVKSEDGDFTAAASITVTETAADPARQMGADGTALGRGASAAAAEKAIMKVKGNNDPAGSVFSVLKLRSTKQGSKTVTLKWTKVKGAAKYIIYGTRCVKGGKMKKIAAAKGSKYVVKKAAKKLKKGKYYKFIVVALDKKGHVVSSSKVIYTATAGTEAGNYKGVKIKKKVIRRAAKLKKGKKLKLTAKLVPVSKKKVAKYCPLRYETSNKKIATVSRKGTVKGIRKGTCFVFAYAQNGVFRKIKVTVR